MKMINTVNKRKGWFLKFFFYSLLAVAFFYIGDVFAANGTAPEGSVGAVAQQITTSFGALAKLITAGAYIAGMGFAVGAIMKFKAHKDNPTQIPIGTPIALIFIAAALIFLPEIFKVTGVTLFKEGAQTGGIQGIESIQQNQ